jgi:hypothetical protein
MNFKNPWVSTNRALMEKEKQLYFKVECGKGTKTTVLYVFAMVIEQWVGEVS